MILAFPIKGKHVGLGAFVQPDLTAPVMNNVRPYDVLERRLRGGQRPGLDKQYDEQISNATMPIVAMASVTVID